MKRTQHEYYPGMSWFCSVFWGRTLNPRCLDMVHVLFANKVKRFGLSFRAMRSDTDDTFSKEMRCLETSMLNL
jgi:hypothetical protein